VPETFCVLLYHHRHGVDVFLTRTPEESRRTMTKLVLDWANDVHDPTIEAQLLHLVSEGRHQEAVDLYTEHAAESFEMQHYQVLGAPSDEALRKLADEKIAELVERESEE
jgi:hypothetical protein